MFFLQYRFRVVTCHHGWMGHDSQAHYPGKDFEATAKLSKEEC